MKHAIKNTIWCLSAILLMLSLSMQAIAANKQITLKTISYRQVTPQQLRIDLLFDDDVKNIKSHYFTIKQPAQLILDFDKTLNQLNPTTQQIGQDLLTKYTGIETPDRTRLILQLTKLVPFKTQAQGNTYSIILTDDQPSKSTKNTHHIRSIAFDPVRTGTGKLTVVLSDPNISVDVQQHEQTITATFPETELLPNVPRTFAVKHLATAVENIATQSKNNAVTLTITTKEKIKYLSYQINNRFMIETDPVAATSTENIISGIQNNTSAKKISLNFQNIKVRAILQILAEFTGLNIVVSDSVKSDITLRLNNVPWEQALEMILKTRGLDQRRYGNVLLVAPTAEIAAQEKQELEAKNQVKELSPLSSHLVQINYAKASDLAKLLKEKDNSLLSSRGHVSVDQRTNTLWILDTNDKISEIRRLVKKLDVPVQQVLIESRIVTVDKNFERDLGIRFGVTNPATVLSGTLSGANEIQAGQPAAQVNFNNRLNVDLPVASKTATAGTLGLALAKLDQNVFLDLELSALEAESRGEIIATPRLITANQQPARIESGNEIPYQESTSSGATSVAFKKAVLSLEVTPQITPDHKIILTMKVNQDRASSTLFNGVPAIVTKQIETKVLVNNGQTVVLGGIYQQTKNYDVARVPLLGAIPGIGALFSHKTKTDQREELLIFVTPKIIQQNYIEGK